MERSIFNKKSIHAASSWSSLEPNDNWDVSIRLAVLVREVPIKESAVVVGIQWGKSSI
jgi:hypothetical protein